MSNVNRHRYFIPLLLLVLSIIPVGLAWLSYYQADFLKLATTNQGELIQPPISWKTFNFYDYNDQIINSDSLDNRIWVLLYLSKTCNDFCEDELLKLRQIRLAFGKDMPRISSILITLVNDDEPIDNKIITSKFPDLTHFMVNKQTFLSLAQLIPQSDTKEISLSAGLLIVDPLGNIMMSYAPSIKPKVIYTDISHLLNTSQLG